MQFIAETKEIKKFKNIREWLIYEMLKARTISGKELWIRTDKWANKLDCNVSTVRKTLKNLIDKKYISQRYHHPHNFISKKYRLVKVIK
jgi:DNA-binding transcriptional regulator YhcF (GntR family)